MVTCTDMAILCGNCPEACFAKYGSIPIRHKSCHEMVNLLQNSIINLLHFPGTPNPPPCHRFGGQSPWPLHSTPPVHFHRFLHSMFCPRPIGGGQSQGKFVPAGPDVQLRPMPITRLPTAHSKIRPRRECSIHGTTFCQQFGPKI